MKTLKMFCIFLLAAPASVFAGDYDSLAALKNVLGSSRLASEISKSVDVISKHLTQSCSLPKNTWWYGKNETEVWDKINNYYPDGPGRLIDIELMPNNTFAFIMIKNEGADYKAWEWWFGLTESQLWNKVNAFNGRIIDIELMSNNKFAFIMIKNEGADFQRWYMYQGYNATSIDNWVGQHFGYGGIVDIEGDSVKGFTVVFTTSRPFPSSHNEVMPIFASPFDKNKFFKLTNHYDHHFPFQFDPDYNDGLSINWQGLQLGNDLIGDNTMNIDGHSGYDWIMPVGTPLYAVADGIVKYIDMNVAITNCPTDQNPTPGAFIEIEHVAPNGDLYTSVYDHISNVAKYAIMRDLKVGDVVKAGELIAYSGNRGCSTEPHLHFQVWRKKAGQSNFIQVDPYGWDVNKNEPFSSSSSINWDPANVLQKWLWKDGEAPYL